MNKKNELFFKIYIMFKLDKILTNIKISSIIYSNEYIRISLYTYI